MTELIENSTMLMLEASRTLPLASVPDVRPSTFPTNLGLRSNGVLTAAIPHRTFHRLHRPP